MNRINPEVTNGDASIDIRSRNSGTEEARLGFINRDKLSSEILKTAAPMWPLGANYAYWFAEKNHRPGGLDLQEMAHYPIWTWESASSMPGICVLRFEPLCATSSSHTYSTTGDIFKILWSQWRGIYTGLEDFQPGDIQVAELTIMMIKMYLAVAKRALKIMAKLVRDPSNAYWSDQSILEAMGFPMTENQVIKQFPAWHTQYNKIVNNLNGMAWFRDLVPGENRWAGLCKEFYRDQPANSRYAQLYMFMPESFWYLASRIDPQTKAITWTMEKSNYRTDSYEYGVQYFSNFLNRIEDMIQDTWYSTSFQTVMTSIQATLNNPKKITPEFDRFAFEALPELNAIPEVEWTYDFRILLAIHNATIMDGLVVENPTLDPETGSIAQTIKATADTNSMVLSHTCKAVNLPKNMVSNSDWFNATQWTVTRAVNIGKPTTIGFIYDDFGSDVIVGADIYVYEYTAEYGLPDQAVLTKYPYLQAIALGYSQENPWIYSYTDELASLALGTQFSMSPLRYLIQPGMSDYYNAHVINLIGETECIYPIQALDLSHLHHQWMCNFWGYPFTLPTGEQGTPQFDVNSMKD